MPLSPPPQPEEEALALLTALLRIDTTNPPGNERPAAEVLAETLRAGGLEPVLLEKESGRTNLVARLKGDGSAGGPLLLTGHLDVVAAGTTGWKHPPFAGEVEDGWLYGRGAVDMKNHLAACATVMRRLVGEGVKLKRDVVFAAVADEETGCALGSQFLVDEHADLVRAEWALGELGGFTIPVGDKRLYPIQVATRGAVWMRLRARGAPGHGAVPREDSAVLRLARGLLRIGNQPLPVHVVEAARRTLQSFGAARGLGGKVLLSLLARPSLTDTVLERAVADPSLRRTFNAMLRNTATPTVLAAGAAANVIPGLAEAVLDGRILPGQSAADLLRELRAVIADPDLTLEVIRELPPVESPIDSPLYRTLAAALVRMDPAAVPFPYLMPGFTDASAFSRLGTKFYGFTPMVLPERPRVAFGDLFHGDDERIPLEGFQRGVDALYDAVVRFCS